MPNFNNAPFLKEAIESVLNQSFKDFIFIIVDDGSSDGSVEIIESYKDARIKLIKKNKNSGIVDALNIGLETIHTKYFIRMDGDDISTKDRFSILVNFMENNPGIDVCGSNIKLFGDSNDFMLYSTNKDKCKAKLIFNNGVGHASAIFRTELLKKNGITYSSKHPYMEDYDLFCRIKKYGEFCNVNQTLYYYRVLNHNSTVKNYHTRLDRYRVIFKDVLNELNIEPSARNIELHLGFFINPLITFSIPEYRNWIDYLILQNKKTGIYPQKALEEIIGEKWEQFFFKVAPLSINKNLTYFKVSKGAKIRQLTYLLKFKINSLLHRNEEKK